MYSAKETLIDTFEKLIFTWMNYDGNEMLIYDACQLLEDLKNEKN